MPQGEVKLKSYGAHPGNFARSAPNTILMITLPAGARREISGICWSYNATPTNGYMTITGGGWNFRVDITTSGPGFIPFDPPVHATDDNQVAIILSAGGAGVVGCLNLLGVGAD